MKVRDLIAELKTLDENADLKYLNCHNKTLDVQDIKFYTTKDGEVWFYVKGHGFIVG